MTPRACHMTLVSHDTRKKHSVIKFFSFQSTVLTESFTLYPQSTPIHLIIIIVISIYTLVKKVGV